MTSMKREKQWLKKIEELDEAVSPFSNHLLRHILLPEILGEDENEILYWAGKSVARKLYDEMSEMDLTHFFQKANWGELTLIKEKKKELQFKLVAPHMIKERPFTLECGFLAQWMEKEKGFITEATYNVKKKDPCTILITVRWDIHDTADY